LYEIIKNKKSEIIIYLQHKTSTAIHQEHLSLDTGNSQLDTPTKVPIDCPSSLLQLQWISHSPETILQSLHSYLEYRFPEHVFFIKIDK
jgi:hypothetical protein